MKTKQNFVDEWKLYETIKNLFEVVAKEQGHVLCFDGIDVGITLSKMSEEQRQNLSAMIKDMQSNSSTTTGYVFANVIHDLNGLKAGFLGLPEGDCFSPRSSGYAKRVKALR